MREALQEAIGLRARRFAQACGVSVSVFKRSSRELYSYPAFCDSCAFAVSGRCTPLHTHLYGSFEAERWGYMYIYHCPMSLIFIATLFDADAQSPDLTLVTGPILITSVADVLCDNGGVMEEELRQLPCYHPARATSIAQTQRDLCICLSQRDILQIDRSEEVRASMHNTLYEITEGAQSAAQSGYPLEIENKLQRMIVHGDKHGAQELINRLLGHVYFGSGGDFRTICQRARELVVLFSRAAIQGGADIGQILSTNRDLYAEIDQLSSLDDLSICLISIFNRYVGYVFDFTSAKHCDIMHKALNYVRENYAGKITLDDVASHVFLSKGHLSKIIRNEMGCSFSDLVNTIRVGKSKDLLLNPSLSIAAVSSLAGFSDQSYYTKVFQKLTGVLPGAYRSSGDARQPGSARTRLRDKAP